MKSPLLVLGILLLLVAIFLGFYAFYDEGNQQAICIDCVIGSLGGGCTYIDDNGVMIQPEDCIPYDMSLTVNNCSEESREADACIEIYQPVCGNDARTYANSCFACMNKMVAFYLEGECSGVIDQKYCYTEEDCACGVHVETGDCFYGNKDFVIETEECPDFCSGIAGNLVIECIEGKCTQTQS